MIEGMIGGTKCKKCKTGNYHFSRLCINKKDVGDGKKFLEFVCDNCNDIYKRPLRLEPTQLKFNI